MKNGIEMIIKFNHKIDLNQYMFFSNMSSHSVIPATEPGSIFVLTNKTNRRMFLSQNKSERKLKKYYQDGSRLGGRDDKEAVISIYKKHFEQL